MGKNKELIINMYEMILNQKKIEQIEEFVDKSYVKEFNNSNKLLFEAFPDIKFKIKEIFEDSGKLITIYDWTGTHRHDYQNIEATNKKVIIGGISIYELKNGKIIGNTAKPDKLEFFLQLGAISKDFLEKKLSNRNEVYFIDEFLVPQISFVSFKERLDYNRDLIKKLDGFVRDDVIIQKDGADNLSVMTIAIWKDEESLQRAKETVQSEYESSKFDLKEFNEKLAIKMQRKIYFPLR
ncbi:ester cyclase [Pedobacter sp. KLB.chiD]|uniref:ester cyclase n=1 Tax=Pedobacter sp. KLB.chiD TaxID=3387402 RepID=UPI00399BFAD1